MAFSFRSASLLLSIMGFALGCRTSRVEPEQQAAPTNSSGPTSAALSPPSLPASENSNDPPASAWEYSGQEPFAGLNMHRLGANLDRATHALILLHGYGAEGDDLVPLGKALNLGADVALLFPEAPVALQRGGRAWFRRDRTNFPTAVSRVELLLSQISNSYPQLGLWLGGFSQGAMVTANVIERAPKQLQAAVLFSGTNLFVEPLKGSRKHDVRVFVSHGSVDPVLPFSGGEATRDAFQSAGYRVEWLPFEGRHTIYRPALQLVRSFLTQE